MPRSIPSYDEILEQFIKEFTSEYGVPDEQDMNDLRYCAEQRHYELTEDPESLIPEHVWEAMGY